MRDYELMTIHRPDLAETDVESKVSEVETFLSESGANISKRDPWGKRRFAYEIDHLTEGYYTVVTFQAEPQLVETLDRRLTFADDVLRHKIVRVDA